MTARSADDPPERVDFNARAATKHATERQKTASAGTTTPSSATTPATPTSTSDGAASGRSEPDGESPTSKTSDEPSKGWTAPHSIKDFAKQVNLVATMVLNGEIDLDTARAYGQLARTVAQATSIEVTKARFAQQMPDLSLDVDEEDDGTS